MTSTDSETTANEDGKKLGFGIFTLVLLVFIAAAGGILTTSLLGNL